MHIVAPTFTAPVVVRNGVIVEAHRAISLRYHTITAQARDHGKIRPDDVHQSPPGLRCSRNRRRFRRRRG